MDPILVCGFPAGSSMGLLATLEWLGQPYRLTRVDMLGEMQEPAYGLLNPRHETPVFITDDGAVLTETMAISAWIEARDDQRTVSFDPASKQADRMHQLMAFINTGFTSAFTPLWAAWEGQMPEEAKAVLRTFGAGLVRKRHDQLERLLGDTAFAAGDRPTLADGVFIGVARWIDVHQLSEPGRWPRIDRLRTRLEADPAVEFAVRTEEGQNPPGSGSLDATISLPELIATYGSRR